MTLHGVSDRPMVVLEYKSLRNLFNLSIHSIMSKEAYP